MEDDISTGHTRKLPTTRPSASATRSPIVGVRDLLLDVGADLVRIVGGEPERERRRPILHRREGGLQLDERVDVAGLGAAHSGRPAGRRRPPRGWRGPAAGRTRAETRRRRAPHRSRGRARSAACAPRRPTPARRRRRGRGRPRARRRRGPPARPSRSGPRRLVAGRRRAGSRRAGRRGRPPRPVVPSARQSASISSPGGLGLLVRRREQRLGRAVAAVPIGEEDGGGRKVLLAEWPHLERHSGSMPFHAGTRTVRAPGVPPRMTLRRRTSFVVDVSWIAPSGLARTST